MSEELEEVIRVAEERAREEERLRYERLVEAFKENWPLLVGGVACLVAGAVLLFDDVSDFGKVDGPHHYFWGILLIIGGAIILGFAFARVVLRLFGGCLL